MRDRHRGPHPYLCLAIDPLYPWNGNMGPISGQVDEIASHQRPVGYNPSAKARPAAAAYNRLQTVDQR